MADGSISGNSGKAVEEYEEMTWFYLFPSPTNFPSPSPDFPPSPPLEFPWSSPPPSSDSRLVLPLAFDGSQPPMENPHQFTTNSLPLLPPPPQNQQQVISPAPQHQDNVFPQYLSAGETAALQRQQLLENWTDALNFSPRGRMMMNNSRGEQSIPIRRNRIVYIAVRQRQIQRQRQRRRHGGDRVVVIRLLRHRLGIFDPVEVVALAYNLTVFKPRGKNARHNFPRRFLDRNRAAESTAPPRTEFPPPPPAQPRNPEEDPGSGRSDAMAAAVDNEVEGLGWGSGTGEGVRRKILEIENKKTRGVRITIPLEDILNYSEMRLVDAAKNLDVSRSTLKRVCREYDIPRWPPRSKIVRRIPQLNSNYLQLGPSNQASLSTVVHTNQPQLSSAKKQPDTDPDTKMRLSLSKQPNNGNIVTVKARYVNNLTIKIRMPWPSSGLVELEQQVAKRLKLEAGTYHIKYKDEEDELILIACDEDFQDYVHDARLKGTRSITVFLEPKQPINYPSNNLNFVNSRL